MRAVAQCFFKSAADEPVRSKSKVRKSEFASGSLAPQSAVLHSIDDQVDQIEPRRKFGALRLPYYFRFCDIDLMRAVGFGLDERTDLGGSKTEVRMYLPGQLRLHMSIGRVA